MAQPAEQPYGQPRAGESDAIRVRVPAKINLRLAVGPRGVDGYHRLDTVYQAISLYDEVTAEPADELRLHIDGVGADTLPTDERNLAVQAATVLADHLGVAPNVALRLHKRIPLAGGLAGGSADAAAVLVACDALWHGGLTRDELAEVAGQLGSDVPFLVVGGTALGTGRGETVNPVLADGPWHWVVAVADGGLSTPTVYAQLDMLRGTGAASEPVPMVSPDIDVPDRADDLVAEPPSIADEPESTDRLLAALRSDDPTLLAAALGNDLQPAAIALRPALRRTLEAGLAAGALAALVSGSGPTCLYLAADADDAARIADEVIDRDVCLDAFVTHGPVAGATVLP